MEPALSSRFTAHQNCGINPVVRYVRCEILRFPRRRSLPHHRRGLVSAACCSRSVTAGHCGRGWHQKNGQRGQDITPAFAEETVTLLVEIMTQPLYSFSFMPRAWFVQSVHVRVLVLSSFTPTWKRSLSTDESDHSSCDADVRLSETETLDTCPPRSAPREIPQERAQMCAVESTKFHIHPLNRLSKLDVSTTKMLHGRTAHL